MHASAALVMGLMVAGMAGCATAPSEQDLASADYGKPMPQAVAEIFATGYLKQRLKDPESARIEWGTIAPGWVRDGVFVRGGGTTVGYLLPASVNAKNSYGGYVGARSYQFMFRDYELVGVWAEEPITSRKTAMIRIK